MEQAEQIGFHKGALSTLQKEREALMELVKVTEQLLAMHVKALQDLGVDLMEQSSSEKLDAKLGK